ncbi:MAG: potassium transporter Kup [Polyangiaceae bacterium]
MSEPVTAPSPVAAPSRPSQGVPSDDGHGHGTGNRYLIKLAFGALGVVYGDIGTSPLYSVRECFAGGLPTSHENVLGILSLISWSLIIMVSFKYIAYVLRADNKGEGGILALMALTSSNLRKSRSYLPLIFLGVFGSALLYGDGMITPAISVLSAVEGLKIAAPHLDAFVVPITIVILIGLFVVQKRGTGGIGAVFGPITFVWFATIATLGVSHIIHTPTVLHAINPWQGVHFLASHGQRGLLVLGGVFLAVTGGEALYADLGHFGRRPIRLAWFSIVFPALLMNYFGQGALLIQHPETIENPFFRMVPGWALYFVVLLSTCATVIASQALISGVYSLTSQATMLGFLPRFSIRHTSARERGQIYIPSVNYVLMLAAIALVLGFKSSDALAAAYGIAVTLTMIITTVLAFYLVRYGWGWGLHKAIPITLVFFIPEMFFVSANVSKIEHGGWVPLAIGATIFTIMVTWKRGREILAERFREQLLPLSDFYDVIAVELPARVPGTAVFMTGTGDGTPPALLHNFLHNRVLHQNIVLLTIVTSDSARIAEVDRFKMEKLDHGFCRVVGRYGFMEQPDAPSILIAAGLIHTVEHTTFFLGRENLVATRRPGMARWRVSLFSFMSRNAQPATKFFNIPPDRVMEIGAQIEL